MTPESIDYDNCRCVANSPKAMRLLFSFPAARSFLEAWFNKGIKAASKTPVEMKRAFFARLRAQLGAGKSSRLIKALTTNIDPDSGSQVRATVAVGDGMALVQYQASVSRYYLTKARGLIDDEYSDILLKPTEIWRDGLRIGVRYSAYEKVMQVFGKALGVCRFARALRARENDQGQKILFPCVWADGFNVFKWGMTQVLVSLANLLGRSHSQDLMMEVGILIAGEKDEGEMADVYTDVDACHDRLEHEAKNGGTLVRVFGPWNSKSSTTPIKYERVVCPLGLVARADGKLRSIRLQIANGSAASADYGGMGFDLSKFNRMQPEAIFYNSENDRPVAGEGYVWTNYDYVETHIVPKVRALIEGGMTPAAVLEECRKDKNCYNTGKAPYHFATVGSVDPLHAEIIETTVW